MTTTWSELRIGAAPRVSVAIAPQLTTLAMLADAVGGRRRGLPEDWRRRVAAGVSDEGRRAILPTAVPGHSVAPDILVPLAPVTDTEVETQVAWLRDAPGDVLVEDLENVFGPDRVPEHWRRVAEHPRGWLRGYARALDDTWSVARPVWRRTGPLFEREIERVGRAVVRGGLETLLNTLTDRIRYADGRLRFGDLEPDRFDLGDRHLVLVPMVAGRRCVIANLDLPGHVWIAYPLPGAAGLLATGEVPPGPARELAAMLGPVRAGLLAMLDHPMTMGGLAARASTVPSAITYHCERLAEAGLVVRERRGREVWVLRTPRGDRLLDLFA